MHSIYTVRSKENSARGIGKRSVTYHSISEAGHLNALKRSITKSKRQQFTSMISEYIHIRKRRELEDTKEIGRSNGRGTNMAMIQLNYSASESENPLGNYEIGSSKEETNIPIIPIIISIVVVLLIIVIIVVIVIVVSRRRKEKVPPNTNAITVVAANGGSKVVHANYVSNNDNTEV